MGKVVLISGAGRGMGVDFARAALAAGHSVLATGRLLRGDQPRAVDTAEPLPRAQARTLLTQADAHRELSSSLTHDDATASA